MSFFPSLRSGDGDRSSSLPVNRWYLHESSFSCSANRADAEKREQTRSHRLHILCTKYCVCLMQGTIENMNTPHMHAFELCIFRDPSHHVHDCFSISFRFLHSILCAIKWKSVWYVILCRPFLFLSATFCVRLKLAKTIHRTKPHYLPWRLNITCFVCCYAGLWFFAFPSIFAVFSFTLSPLVCSQFVLFTKMRLPLALHTHKVESNQYSCVNAKPKNEWAQRKKQEKKRETLNGAPCEEPYNMNAHIHMHIEAATHTHTHTTRNSCASVCVLFGELKRIT